MFLVNNKGQSGKKRVTILFSFANVIVDMIVANLKIGFKSNDNCNVKLRLEITIRR